MPDPVNGTVSATVDSAEYTSTHSIFNLTAGAASISLDFFSPVSPKNLLRQSLPFSYLTVTVSSASSSPDVQIYSDIDGSWTGQASDASYTNSDTNGLALFEWSANNAATYSQSANEQALWGNVVFASTGNTSKLTTAAGSATTVRSEFANSGSLGNTYAAWTADAVTALTHDIGTVSGSATVTFAIGHVRESAINYFGSPQTHYFRATYDTTAAAVTAFLADYADAYTESLSFDALIQNAGEASSGSNYSDILALSVRQTFGGFDLTIPADTLSTTNPYAFIKEISSDGNMNTIDVIYPTFPLLYMVGPMWIKMLLVPVMDYLQTGQFPEVYPVHDIGTNYPNGTGHNDLSGELMPIEESGNVILLLYAYETATGNADFRDMYPGLFKQYADYLAANGEYPASQLSVNDALGALPNQTNLGVKAAVGLAAYGELTGQSNYTDLGRQFGDVIYTDHVGTDSTGSYFTLEYGSPPWFLIFNVYPDVLFNFDVFPAEAYNSTSDFYPTVRDTAGIPLDGAILWGQTNWQSFVAATVEESTREIFINDLHAYIANGQNTAPFSDRYWVAASGSNAAGDHFAFRARPTLGSHFAQAAKGRANVWS